MRDDLFIIPSLKSCLRNQLTSNLTNTTPNKRYVDGKKVEEHYALIMTKVVPTKDQLATLPKIQHQVYDLVLKTTLAMFADPYEYEETTIVTQVGDANFKATGKVPTKQGWQALFDDHKANQQEAATLPLVHQGDQVQANLQTPQKETTPPGSSNLIATAMIKKSGDKIINANALTQKSNARLHE